MKTELTFENDAKKKILAGVKKLSDAVGCTLGAQGKTVIYEYGGEAGNMPLITKDGVTVAKHIQLEDPVERFGAELVKQASQNTVDAAGDGTTTSTVLAGAILELSKDKNANRDFLLGLTAAEKAVLEYIEANKKKFTTAYRAKVATISVNNDKELGGIISKAFEKAGQYGNVGAEPLHPSQGTDTILETEPGHIINSGLVDANFANVPGHKCFLENPYIFISTSKNLGNIRQLQGILEPVIRQNRSILIIADLEPQLSTTLLKNKIEQGFKINVIKPPMVLDVDGLLKDVAVITGATIHGDHLGDDPDGITPELLGECDFAKTDKNGTYLKFENKPEVKEHVNHLKTLIKEEQSKGRKEEYQRRLANVAGTTSVIKVGAASEAELKEKFDRIEDAIHAVRAAKDGLIPGGGVLLKDACAEIEIPEGSESFIEGFHTLLGAIKAPFYKILSNAGLEAPQGLEKGFGVDVTDGLVKDMFAEDIIDPVKVCKQALINAVSVSRAILTTGCAINVKS